MRAGERERGVGTTPTFLAARRRDERDRSIDSGDDVGDADRSARGDRELGGVAEVERVRAEDERAAARRRLDQVLAAERMTARILDVADRGAPGRRSSAG